MRVGGGQLGLMKLWQKECSRLAGGGGVYGTQGSISGSLGGTRAGRGPDFDYSMKEVRTEREAANYLQLKVDAHRTPISQACVGRRLSSLAPRRAGAAPPSEFLALSAERRGGRARETALRSFALFKLRKITAARRKSLFKNNHCVLFLRDAFSSGRSSSLLVIAPARGGTRAVRERRGGARADVSSSLSSPRTAEAAAPRRQTE